MVNNIHGVFFFLPSSLQKLFALQTCDEELGINEPHCYTDEGQPLANNELDAISIPADA